MKQLADKYITQDVEKKWQQEWETQKIYQWDADESRENSYVIDTPPPTVSGMLHMGHIFSYTQADIIARYQRMSGKNVFYPMGFDDNGLPTERLVEKVKGVRAGQMERAQFINLCKEVVDEAEEEFRKLFRSVALSVDWAQEYQTISPRSRKISQMSFLDLFKKSHVEQRKAPTFWDPVDRTAIAQAEIEDKERQGFMNDIIFTTEDGENIVIATTRPELIPACVAVLYHPEDSRYKHLSGKNAITPIWGASVPLVADEDVDIEKGTGLVMCCTFGDIQDIHWWRRHNLELKECVTLNGKMQNTTYFDGQNIKEAKENVLQKLQELGLLKQQTPVTQFVKCAERSGAPLEIITTQQWYIKILDKKEAIIEKARNCQWYPEFMRTRLEIWANGLNQDWCISRQRYFGVPFPVWYSKRAGEEGKILIADQDQLPVDPMVDLPKGYSSDEVTPDLDVMDTWATSSISPQLNSWSVSDEFSIDAQRHSKLYPADLRPQAHEIIRTWAFYTIVKSMLHEDVAPWKNLIISGWCLAADKTKMSKSKGNIVTPTDLIISKGADVVRYWASTSKLGVDIAYSEEIFKIGGKLLTKLWNASKFVSIHLNAIHGQISTPSEDVKNGIIFESLDLWILSRLKNTVEKATHCFKEYEYSDARVAVEDFFWNDFCDNYLELMKVRIYNEDASNAKARQSAIYALSHCLKTLFKLFAPFMPHVTEELNHSLFGGQSIHIRGSWPNAEEHYFHEASNKVGLAVTRVLELVRKYKSVNNMSLKVPLEEVSYTGDDIDSSAINDLKNAANAKTIIRTANLSGELISSDNHEFTARIIKAEEEIVANS